MSLKYLKDNQLISLHTGGTSLIDDKLNLASENPVQNKTVTSEINSLKIANTSLNTAVSSVSKDLETTNTTVSDLSTAIKNRANDLSYDPSTGALQLKGDNGTIGSSVTIESNSDDTTYVSLSKKSITLTNPSTEVTKITHESLTNGYNIVLGQTTWTTSPNGYTINRGLQTSDGGLVSWAIDIFGGDLGYAGITMQARTSSQMSSSYYFSPVQDNAMTLGGSSSRWQEVYVASGVINTSDKTQKKDIDYYSNEWADNFIDKLKPCSFKFLDGTSGRTHYGLIAQDVEDSFDELGITSTDFAGFIKSQKTKFDGEKNTFIEIEGEYDYALRYDEFISILIKKSQSLQAQVDELKTEIKELKGES